MKLRFIKFGLASLFMLVSVSTTFAADATQVKELTPSEVLMQEVAIIGSKFNIKDIAASAAFLDTQDIRQHGVADVNRLLRRVPGVNIRQEDGFGLFPNFPGNQKPACKIGISAFFSNLSQRANNLPNDLSCIFFPLPLILSI